jgi:multidrug efflux pump
MNNDVFETMPVPKAYFKMALPVVFGMVISLVYNMVDTWFIAKTQNTSLVAGVSLCAPVFSLMIAFGDIFGLGGSSAISRLFGKKDYDTARRISAFCLLGSIFFGIAVAVLMLLFQTPILHLLGARDDTITYAGAYYRFLVLGCPAIIFNIVPGNLLRTEGLANDAMIGSVIGAVFNIFLDPIFIFSLHMGAGGAALATILSNLLADCYLVWVVFKKAGHLSMSCREMHISSGHVRDILLIGIPASITNLMQSFAVLLTNRFLLPYGSDKVAALGIALKVNMITMLILVGFAFGAQPLLGYCYGADNRERLKQFLHFDLLVQLLIALVFTAAACIFAPHIIRIFMQDDVIVASGALMLRCLMITAPVIGMILVFTTLFQAAGMALPAFLMSISRQGVLLVLCMLLFSSLFGYMGILLAQAVSDVLTGILGFLLLRRSKILL